MTDTLNYTKIPNRGLIILSGHDSMSFLQGLITQDINLLHQQDSIYSWFLTPNGKFLFDFFITKNQEQLFIECEGQDRASDLLKRLQMFKLRSDVEFELNEQIDVYASFEAACNEHHYLDPRHADMGWRTLEKPSSEDEIPFDTWDLQRIKLGIPDGSRDMTPQRSTLLDFGIDRYHGVSFDKGCYMGQELTARMHYRALSKKVFIPVEFNAHPPEPQTDLLDGHGKLIGQMCSSCENIGLALLKKDSLKAPEELPFTPLFSSEL